MYDMCMPVITWVFFKLSNWNDSSDIAPTCFVLLTKKCKRPCGHWWTDKARGECT